MSVITYNADALYRSRFSSAADSAAKRQMLSTYVRSRKAVNAIFETKELGKLPTPYTFADIKGVYRPEDRAADQAEINRIIRDIQKKTAEDEAAKAAKAA